MPLALRDYLAFVRANALPNLGQFGTFSDVKTAPPRADAEPGGDPSASSSPATGIGDTLSLGGRLALNQDLNVNAHSVGKEAIGLMGLLSGPIGTLAGKAAIAGINAHNSSSIRGALAAAGHAVGMADPEDVADAINEAIGNYSDVGSSVAGLSPGQAAGHGPQGGHNANDPNAPAGFLDAPPAEANVPDANAAATAADAAATSGGNTGTGPTGGPAYHAGGVVRDRQKRPNLEERIRAQEGEYVVRRGTAEKYSKLLGAINAGHAPTIKRALKEALTA